MIASATPSSTNTDPAADLRAINRDLVAGRIDPATASALRGAMSPVARDAALGVSQRERGWEWRRNVDLPWPAMEIVREEGEGGRPRRYLTKTETSAARLLAEGRTRSEIARELDVKAHCLEDHLSAARRALSVPSTRNVDDNDQALVRAWRNQESHAILGRDPEPRAAEPEEVAPMTPTPSAGLSVPRLLPGGHSSLGTSPAITVASVSPWLSAGEGGHGRPVSGWIDPNPTPEAVLAANGGLDEPVLGRDEPAEDVAAVAAVEVVGGNASASTVTLDHEAAPIVEAVPPRGSTVVLTARQREIIGLLYRNLWPNRIAHELGLSSSTVCYQCQRIREAFGVSSNEEAVLAWEATSPKEITDEDRRVRASSAPRPASSIVTHEDKPSQATRPVVAITERRREILARIDRGEDAATIAAALGVTQSAIYYQLQRARAEYGVATNEEAVVAWHASQPSAPAEIATKATKAASVPAFEEPAREAAPAADPLPTQGDPGDEHRDSGDGDEPTGPLTASQWTPGASPSHGPGAFLLDCVEPVLHSQIDALQGEVLALRCANDDLRRRLSDIAAQDQRDAETSSANLRDAIVAAPPFDATTEPDGGHHDAHRPQDALRDLHGHARRVRSCLRSPP